MKIMSVEKAWLIRWQVAPGQYREGDRLGNITITRIEPSSRSVITLCRYITMMSIDALTAIENFASGIFSAGMEFLYPGELLGLSVLLVI